MTTESTPPAETRTKPRAEAAKWTAEQKATVADLAALQTKLNLSNELFVQQWLPEYSASAWSLAKSDKYGASDNAKLFAAIEGSLRHIRRVLRRKQTATKGGEFYEFPLFTAMFKAVEDCLTIQGENRLIVYVAPTGCAKSRFFHELDVRTGVKLSRANETWHGSYFNAMSDVIRAIAPEGSELEMPRSAKDGRAQMLALMKSKLEVLGIDEGNYFGPRSINLVKDILNETAWPVVLCLTPAAWVKMQRYSHEFGQLRRRIHTVFEHEPLTAADAGRFLDSAGLNGDAKPASVLLADAANEFGGFDFANRVVEAIQDGSGAAHPTLKEVESAINLVKKQLGLVGK